ncbi:AraC family transcriptional regulator [Stenotrophomonas daejeonensis]|uniref:AraC family transcriptional regulator n=1 Tax=Stenotrophomonas daejeonensis TaxID=659018 RepID=A0A0R0ECQ6_9GAMM|nr:AraC family transcriptional regulator [Stenotrophomonas daejeonensis]KRG88067.1 AraC family transcriptional regulator [Stenotrophomonas daejeonensis]
MDAQHSSSEVQHLFDALPDTVFFVKDREGRYTHCNVTLVQRLGRKRRGEVIGRSPLEVFPPPLGNRYLQQDRQVLAGTPIADRLEVHLYPNRRPGWCLTLKRPLFDDGRITGLIGVSRDLGRPNSRHSAYAQLERVVNYMQEHSGENPRTPQLAELAGISLAQLERHFRHVFQVTPQQYLIKLRIEMAMRLLRGDGSIAGIGQCCGFSDQSAFARQFKATVGMTPSEYRGLDGVFDGVDPAP